jgi:alpha-galactosidase
MGSCANSLRGNGGNIGDCESSDAMKTDTAVAVRFAGTTDPDGFPLEKAWDVVPAVRFDADWRGLNGDTERGTEVRMLWTPETLYLRFVARYRSITVFPDADARGWRDKLWERDVCEAFLQSDPAEARRYKEIEVAPNGFWIDLDIAPGEKQDLRSGMRRRVEIDEPAKRWRALVALPMKSLTARFDPASGWRVNFFRVEGAMEPRFYSAWQATGTPQPNFHVPEAFGKLAFAQAGER